MTMAIAKAFSVRNSIGKEDLKVAQHQLIFFSCCLAMDDVIISLDHVSKKSIKIDGKTESPHIRSDQAKELEHRARIFLTHKVKEAVGMKCTDPCV